MNKERTMRILSFIKEVVKEHFDDLGFLDDIEFDELMTLLKKYELNEKERKFIWQNWDTILEFIDLLV